MAQTLRLSRKCLLQTDMTDCAPVCDLGTLGPHVRFSFHTEWLKMHHNDLKCGGIVDNFCYIVISQSHFVLLKQDGGGGNVG